MTGPIFSLLLDIARGAACLGLVYVMADKIQTNTETNANSSTTGM